MLPIWPMKQAATDTSLLALVAGEPSGDLLGAELMRQLTARRPDMRFIGVGGPHMRRAGLQCLYPMERLSLHGFISPLLRAPQLLWLMWRLRRAFLQRHACGFVGIDFNVFNLMLEAALKRRGMTTVHYVSPSVYAWRRGRTKRVGKAVHRLLTLYPFEPELYRAASVDVVFVGHPTARQLQPAADKTAPRAALGIAADAPLVLTMLPGSRRSELKMMLDSFLATAAIVCKQVAGCQVLIALLNEDARQAVQAHVQEHFADLPVLCTAGQSRLAMQAADLVLTKAGTASLEAMIIGRPMVVTYKLPKLTHFIVSHLLVSRWVGLPNILANEPLVPELIQDQATPEALAKALLAERQRGDALCERFAELTRTLRGDEHLAADAVLELVDAPPRAAQQQH